MKIFGLCLILLALVLLTLAINAFTDPRIGNAAAALGFALVLFTSSMLLGLGIQLTQASEG